MLLSLTRHLSKPLQQSLRKTSSKQVRFFNIHEYQGINLLKSYGIKVLEGDVATTPEEAEAIARKLNFSDLVVKSQVHSGGRAKGTFDNGFKGGIHVCNTPEEVKTYSSKMLNHRLITAQSGPEGKLVTKLFIGKRHFIRREAYFAIVLDRSCNGPVMIGSSRGGVDIEAVAAESPSDIHKEPFRLEQGPSVEQRRSLAEKMGFRGPLIDQASEQMFKLYEFFVKKDATLIEINPFCETSDGSVLCLDSKLNFDTNALFRQPDLIDLKDVTQEDPRETEAGKLDLNYIGLDGNIGCLVNGAGLAMATMDMIQFYGGSPANFLDIGGGATDKQVSEALRILASDLNVKAVLINIFGGIMKCDVIAIGILSAVKSLNLKLPLVLRLQGTNVSEAKKIIENSGLRVIAADDLDEAATKAVRVAHIAQLAQEAQLNVSFELPL